MNELLTFPDFSQFEHNTFFGFSGAEKRTEKVNKSHEKVRKSQPKVNFLLRKVTKKVNPK